MGNHGYRGTEVREEHHKWKADYKLYVDLHLPQPMRCSSVNCSHNHPKAHLWDEKG